MRILHISDAYLPKQGGIEVQVHDLACQQHRRGNEVHILTSAPDRDRGPDLDDPCPDDPELTGSDAEPQVLRLHWSWQRPIHTYRRICRTLDRLSPDAVHLHLSVWSPLAFLAARASTRRRIPTVATIHSLWWMATPLYVLSNVVLHWSRWPIHWTAVSELAARPLRPLLEEHREITILPNGVEPSHWAVEPLERDPRDVRVVSVMRLASRKRPRPLLRVIRRAVDMLPEGTTLKVTLIGDGPQRSRLEREILRLGLQDVVHLAGRMDRAGIREVYRRADLYVAPATLESFGIAALEARSAGLPVLAREQTGIADFIRPGQHGLLAASDIALSSALADLASSPERRRVMAEHNRHCAPETGWAEVLQRCNLAYKLADDLARCG
ncbi:MAG: hypothetical protein QG608_2872 [Actinomycetota bacterium]|nr:hypothetical protein [Actinomycetota bacterium]